MSSEGANAAGGGPDIGVRTPRQSAIRMMETMKTLAPAERRPAAPQRKSEQTASSAGAHGSPSETPQAKRKQAPPQPAAAAPEPVTVKRRRQQSSPEVGVLEWLEAEAEKRPVDNAPAAALPRGLEPPERPPAPALLFLQKIRSRIRQPPGAAWSLKQLAQGVTRLFEALPPTHQQQYRNAAKEAMDKYKAEMARIRPQGSKAVESSTDQGQRGRAPSAYKVYERNVMPRLRHANPDKQEEELIKMCKKEWASISEKEKRTYQFLAERDRERLRTQELLWREASGTARQPKNEGGGVGAKDRSFHTLIPQFCAFCGQPLLTYVEPKKHCKSCGRAFALEIVAFSVGRTVDSLGAKDDPLDLTDL